MKASAIIIVVVLSWSGQALAEVSRVAIVAVVNQAPVVSRLEAEIGALSFESVILYHGDLGLLGAEEILHIVNGEQIGLVLSVASDARRVEVWRVEEDSSRIVHVGTTFAPSGDESDAGLAIRTAEFLRATFIEVEDSPAPQELEPEVDENPSNDEDVHVEDELPTPEIDESLLRIPTHRRLEIGLGAGGWYSPGGVGLGGCMSLEAAWMPRHWVGVHALGIAPLHNIEITGPEGRAKILPAVIGVGARFKIVPQSSRLSAVFDVGLAIGLIGISGEAIPPYTSLDTSLAPTEVTYLRPRLAIRLTRWLQLAFDAFIGVALPRAVVTFAGRRVAIWGQPIVGFGMSLGGMFVDR